MDYLGENDIYEIKIASIISNVDKDVIMELYQPLVGSLSTILYLTLLKQQRNEDEDMVFKTENLLSTMQVSPGNLLLARKGLEAVGLLRSYQKEENGHRFYIYILFAPKTPKEFFDDVLFKGLLIQYIGEKETRRLASHYKIDLTIPEGYEEVSASFIDVFNPDYDDPAFRKNINNSLLGHEVGRVNIELNYDLFFKYIEDNSQIVTKTFTKKDMRELERLSALFGLNEKTLASIVIDEYMPHENPHLNFDRIADRAKEQIKYPFLQKVQEKSKVTVTSDSINASLVRLMEDQKVSPVKYLQYCQNNVPPSIVDVEALNKVSAKYNLPPSVMKAAISYVLQNNNDILTLKYLDKIASTLAREGITNSVDAMNCLYKIKKDMESRSKVIKKSSESITTTKPQTSSKRKVEEIDDKEIDDLINEIEEMKRRA